MATFVKLDAGILNSTLWVDLHARIVFITALLMAEPIELTEAMPQINVSDLTLTGWEVPPGWYGMVPAAGIGIVHRAGLERDVGIEALQRLGAQDTDSRSKDHEGRRLVRVNGGYIVLNFVKYRERDYTGADRSKRWRERQKALRAATRDVSNATRDITQEEREVEGEVERENTSAHANAGLAPYPSGETTPATRHSTDAERWPYEQSQPWARGLKDAGCKIGSQNWRLWKTLVEQHGDRVHQVAKTVPATDRWPDQVEVALSKPSQDTDRAAAIKRKMEKTIHVTH